MIAKGSNFLDLARRQSELFVDNNVAWCNVLVSGSCIRSIMLLAYNALVREKKLVSIENLTQEEKEKAWEIAKEMAAGQLKKAQLIEMVKSLMALEYFLNL